MSGLLQHLQESLERERGFADDVAHELRTPLTAQISLAQTVLSRRTSTAEMRDCIAQLLEEARHMKHFTQQLLELTRISTRQPSIGSARVNVRTEISACSQLLQVLAEEKSQRLSFECRRELTVLGDATMLRQALMNVVHNAIEHCAPHASIVIRAYENGTGAAAQAVTIEVDDNGPGIATELRSKVFSRFCRGAPSGPHGSRGLGLGLSIARALTEAQNGSIWLADKPTAGSRFCLRLHRAPEPRPDYPPVLTHSAVGSAAHKPPADARMALPLRANRMQIRAWR
jgi:signal transduction histidine kinase